MASTHPHVLFDPNQLSAAARNELTHLGLLCDQGTMRAPASNANPGAARLGRRAIGAPEVLNEAPSYGAAFSRGLRLEFGGLTALMISGTASVDENGATVHVGDFAAQCFRTYRNIAALLAAEGATWHDVVRTRCYLRDIERDYDEFNRIRSSFFVWMNLNPLPASVGIQARLCRSDLLIEIEATAVLVAP